MPPPARADFLLIAGIDESALDRQIDGIARRFNTTIAAAPAAPTTLIRGLDQAAASAGRVVASLGQVNDAQRAVGTTTERSRRELDLWAKSIVQQGRAIQENARFDQQWGFARVRMQREYEAAVRAAGVTQSRAVTDNMRLDQQMGFMRIRAQQEYEAAARSAGVIHSRAITDNMRLDQQAGLLRIRAQREYETAVRAAGVTQSRAVTENMRLDTRAAKTRIDQMRELDRFLHRLDSQAGGRPTTPEVQAIVGARAGLLTGPALDPVALSRLRGEMEAVNRAVAATNKTIALHHGFLDGMADRAKRVVQFAIPVVATYAAIGLAMKGLSTAVEIDRQLTQMSATMLDQTTRGAALANSHGLITKAMTTLGLGAKESGNLVFELGKVLDSDAEKMTAAFAPALALTSLKETEQAETVRVLVGLYNIYGETLTSAITDTQKFTKISDVLLASSFASVASVQDFNQALQFVGPSAKQAGLPMENLVTLLGLLQNNLVRASTSGTGLFNLLQQFTVRAPEIAQAFDIDISDQLDGQINTMQLMLDVMNKVRNSGPQTVEMLRKLEKAFPDIRGERAFRSLTETIDKFDAQLAKARESAGTTDRVLATLGKSVSAAAGALGAHLVIQLDAFFSALLGVDQGQMQGLAITLTGIGGAIRAVGEASSGAIAFLREFLAEQRKAAQSAFGGGGKPLFGLGDLNLSADRLEAEKRAAHRLRALLGLAGPSALQQELGLGRSPNALPDLSLRPPGGGGLMGPGYSLSGPGGSMPGIDPSGQSFGVKPGSFPIDMDSRARWQKKISEVIANVQREARLSDTSTLRPERIAAGQADLTEAESDLARLQGVSSTTRSDADLKNIERAAKEVEARRSKLRQLQKEDADEHFKLMVDDVKAAESFEKQKFDLQREFTAKSVELNANKFDAFKFAAQEDLGRDLDAAGQLDDTEAMTRLMALAWQNYHDKIHNFDVAAKQEALGVLGQWGEAVDALLGGETRVVDQEYNLQRGVVESHFAVLLADETLSVDERAAIQQKYYDARDRMDADYFGRQEAAAIADLQAMGRREAQKTGYLLSEMDKRSIAAESAAQVEIQRAELLVRVRAGVAEKTAAYYADERNMALETAAAGIAADAQLVERRLHNLETLNTAVQRSTDLRLRIAEQEAQAGGKVADFLILSFKRSADAAGDFWKGLGTLANETARSMSQTLSDVFFDKFNDQLKSAEDYFKSFITSMKRAIADFLAQQTVKAFASLLLGVAGAALGTGGGGGGGTNLSGSSLTTGNTAGQNTGAGFDITGTVVNLAAKVITEYFGGLFGSGVGAAGSAGGLGIGLTNLGMNFTYGGTQGVVLGLTLAQAQAAVYAEAYGFAISQGATEAVAAVYATELANGASTSGGLSGAGGVAGPAATALAAIAAAYQVYSGAMALYEERYGAAAGNIAGGVVGGIVGGLVTGGNPLGILAGLAIGSVLGELIGGLFDTPEMTHEMREAMERNETLQGAQTFQDKMINAKNFASLGKVLLAQQSGWYGGDTSTERADHANPTVEMGIRRDGKYFHLGNGRNDPGRTITVEEFLEAARRNPDSVYARIQSGVAPGMLEEANRALQKTILEKIRQLDETQARVNMALVELFKGSTTPATLNDAIMEDAEKFKKTIAEVNKTIQTELERAWVALSVMNDPDEIIEQTQKIKGLIEARYNTEIQLIQAYAGELEKIFGIWKQLGAAAGEQVVQLQLSNMAPPNPKGQMQLARGRFDAALSEFRDKRTPESAERLRSLIDDVLRTSGDVYARPSKEYAAIFSNMISALREIEAEAAKQQGTIQKALDILLGEGNDLARLNEQNTKKIADLMAELKKDFVFLIGKTGFGPGGQMSDTLRRLLADPPDPRRPLPPKITETEVLILSLARLTGSVIALDQTMAAFAPGGPGPGSYEIGTPYVPSTGPAYLHQGEMVLAAGPASSIRQHGFGGGNTSLSITINVAGGTPLDARAIACAVRDELHQDLRTGMMGRLVVERVRHSR